MPGRDRSRPWGTAEAGVTLLLEGIRLRSDRFLVNDARKGAFAWRPGGARTCATTSVRRVDHAQAADGPNSSQLESHQDGVKIKVRNNSQQVWLRNQGEDHRAFPGQGGPSGAVRPAPPIRDHKRERAKRPPRRPTRADPATPSVSEKNRLDFKAGLELHSRAGTPPRNGGSLLRRSGTARCSARSVSNPHRLARAAQRIGTDGPRRWTPSRSAATRCQTASGRAPSMRRRTG
jgi:hypothetical protein